MIRQDPGKGDHEPQPLECKPKAYKFPDGDIALLLFSGLQIALVVYALWRAA